MKKTILLAAALLPGALLAQNKELTTDQLFKMGLMFP